jgi:hypothetical protein
MKAKHVSFIYLQKFADDFTAIALASPLTPDPSPAYGRGGDICAVRLAGNPQPGSGREK